jgi:hypothetical protein
LVDGTNVFVYARNHPTVSKDSTGHQDEPATISQLTVEEDVWGWVRHREVARSLPQDTWSDRLLKSGALLASNLGVGTQFFFTAARHPVVTAGAVAMANPISQQVRGTRLARESGAPWSEALDAGVTSAYEHGLGPMDVLAALKAIPEFGPNAAALTYHVAVGESPPTPYTFLFGPRTLEAETMNFVGSAGAVAGLGLSSLPRPPVKSTITVTSWAEKGITPDLNPGRWVQLGGPGRWNYLKTGLWGPKIYYEGIEDAMARFHFEGIDDVMARSMPWGLEGSPPFQFVTVEGPRVPFANSITGEVPASSLQWPPGIEVPKAVLGQRVLKQ